MAIGIISIVVGTACILWGDTDLKVKEGLILKAFSWSKGSAKWLKWPMGIAFIYAGVRMIISSNY